MSLYAEDMILYIEKPLRLHTRYTIATKKNKILMSMST